MKPNYGNAFTSRYKPVSSDSVLANAQCAKRDEGNLLYKQLLYKQLVITELEFSAQSSQSIPTLIAVVQLLWRYEQALSFDMMQPSSAFGFV